MEGVVAAGFGVCCFMPFLKGGQQAGPRFRNNMVNWGRKICVTSQDAQDPSCSNGSLFPAIIITIISNISITTVTIPYPPIIMIITTTYIIQTNTFSITILFIITNINAVIDVTIIIKIINSEMVTTISVFITTTATTTVIVISSSSSSSPSLSWLLIECLWCITHCHKGFM